MLKNIIDRRIVSVAPDTRVSEVALRMAKEDVGAILVLDDDQTPRGIVTDRDIVVRCVAENVDVNDCTIEQILSEPIEVVRETDGVFDCIRKMNEAKVRRIPVVNEQGEAVGIISFGDLIALLGRELSELVEAATPKGGSTQVGQLRAA
jgi:signal-transduction protein with cAMP-binding, CBS, and nucleotidyltransferase domain